jgi:phosphatidate cytidylyltransferase
MGGKAKSGGFFDRNFFLRAGSTVVLVPLTVFIVWKGGYYLTGLLIASALLMDFEWAKLTRLSAAQKAVLTAGAVAACWWLVAMGDPHGLVDGVKLAVLVGLTVIGIGLVLKKHSPVWLGLGLLCIPAPLLSVGLMALMPDGRLWILWMLILIWVSDTGAYLAGRTLKGRKLAPSISPAKTWSGLLGGIVTGALVAGLAGTWLGLGSGVLLGALGGGLSIVGHLGDLAESALKRHFGVKDTGILIPGQGGILDRLDSLVFVAPVLALGLWLAQAG